MSSQLDTQASIARQDQLMSIFRWAITIVAVAFALFPVAYIIRASFDPTGSLSARSLIVENPSLENYRALFNDPLHPFHIWLWNSIKISSITTVLAVFVTALSAYAFSRFRFRGRRSLLMTILLVQVFPNMLLIVALFLLIQQIGTYIPSLGLNSHGGLILVYLGGVMGVNVWLMKGFFDSIPRELDESARVDGASDWQIFWRIIFPLVRPIMVVIGILTFIATYGDFILARVLLQTTQEYTFMVGLYLFVSEAFSQNWGVFAAGSLIAALPIVAIYLALQDQIVGGLTQGAVKG